MRRFRTSDKKAAGLAALWVAGAGVAGAGWATTQADERDQAPTSEQRGVDVLGSDQVSTPTTTTPVVSTTVAPTTSVAPTTTSAPTTVASTTSAPTTVVSTTSAPTASTEGSPEVAVAELETLLDGQSIQFMFSTAIPTPQTEALVADLAELLHSHPDLRLHIVGHTDPSGNAEANQMLSQARAQSVANHMILRGVDGSRMTVEGRGSSEPVADNSTQWGKEQNRRVVITATGVEPTDVDSPQESDQ